MDHKPRKHEGQNASAEASGGGTPLEKFQGLTRRLLKVSPEQLREEQRRYEKAKDTKKK
jgi:hypothetical protein